MIYPLDIGYIFGYFPGLYVFFFVRVDMFVYSCTAPKDFLLLGLLLEWMDRSVLVGVIPQHFPAPEILLDCV